MGWNSAVWEPLFHLPHRCSGVDHGIPKSSQKLLLADQKILLDQNHISSNWRTAWWRPGWAKSPCRLLWLTPWSILQILWHIFPKDCPGFRLMDLKTEPLKHCVDPWCWYVCRGCAGWLRNKHLPATVFPVQAGKKYDRWAHFQGWMRFYCVPRSGWVGSNTPSVCSLSETMSL